MEPKPEYHVDPPLNPADYPQASVTDRLPDLSERPEQLLAEAYRAWDGRSYELRCPACSRTLFLSYIEWRAALDWPKHDPVLDPVGYVCCQRADCPSRGQRFYLEPQARYFRRKNTILQQSLSRTAVTLPRKDRPKRARYD